MTQTIEFFLSTENYFEYLRLLSEHGTEVAHNYARVVTREDYKNRKPLTSPRMKRG
jgi:hypothetical protein